MRRLALTCLAVALLLPPPPARGQSPPDPLALVEAAGRVYREVAGICADFRQVLSVPLLGEDRKGRGRLCTQQPDRFAMRFTEPAGDLVVADGEWLWLYMPSTDARQVLRFPLAAGPRGVDFYREFLEAPREKYRSEYRGRETVDGTLAHHVVLTPLQAAPYRTAELWIAAEEALLCQVVIREQNGSVRTVTLSAIEVSPGLGADVFRFTPPTGAQVITP